MSTRRAKSKRRARRRAVRELRRPCDRWQTRLRWCLLILLAVSLVTVVPAVGRTVGRARLHTAREQAAHRHRVTAYAVTGATGRGTRWTEDLPRRIPVRWRDTGGGERSATVEVPSDTTKGAPVPVWLDETGVPVRAPLSHDKAVGRGWAAAGAATGGLLMVFLAAWAGPAAAANRARYARWARECQAVETEEYPEVKVREDAVLQGSEGALLEASRDADVMVIAAHRRTHALGLQLGPVTHAMLHHAHCPVTLVPVPADAS
ncbi:universal stress protein [Streptomyces orinoci]|uniref:Universal stress protein n=1 Tax=Streptomyces orinoci TaxID=67339 RepID=A0ABV3K592_STRON|nr:universal stress protein [Streptomyces orinoci]